MHVLADVCTMRGFMQIFVAVYSTCNCLHMREPFVVAAPFVVQHP
jgi:hypothetical protein